MSEALYKATTELAEGDLSRMVLAKEDLPDRFKEFPVSQEIILDNEAMAEHGIPGTTPEETRATGRLTGYLLEFTNHVAIDALTRDPTFWWPPLFICLRTKRRYLDGCRRNSLESSDIWKDRSSNPDSS